MIIRIKIIHRFITLLRVSWVVFLLKKNKNMIHCFKLRASELLSVNESISIEKDNFAHGGHYYENNLSHS